MTVQTFNTENIEAEVTALLRNWVKLLSENKFEDAVQQLDVPTKPGRTCWNAAFLKEVIDEGRWWNSPQEKTVINNPYLMDLSREKTVFYFYHNSSGFAVEYDLPMNGEWSDLTASFSFEKSGTAYAVYLEAVHVL